MNILVFSWRGPKHPLAGGAEQVMHEHMKGWVNAGHKVTLFTSYFSGANNEEKIDSIRVIRKGNQLLGVHLAAFVWYLTHNNFDLVIDQFHGIPFFTPLYVYKKKLAVLQEVAREVWLKNDLPWPVNLLIGGLGYFIEPLFFLFYKNIQFMVGSDSAKADLSKIGIDKNKITVIPHGVIIKKIKKPQKEKEETVTFLGALARDKGIEDAIEIFKELSHRKNIQFWIIGKGGEEYVKTLKKKCKEYKISTNTKFWGFVTDDKKLKLLARSHVMINPSSKEGWGLVNIEANAMGTPVVAYKNPGLVDSVKQNISGLLVKSNPEELAKEVDALLDNKNKLQALSKSSIVWSKNFSWKKSKKLSLNLIKKL